MTQQQTLSNDLASIRAKGLLHLATSTFTVWGSLSHQVQLVFWWDQVESVEGPHREGKALGLLKGERGVSPSQNFNWAQASYCPPNPRHSGARHESQDILDIPVPAGRWWQLYGRLLMRTNFQVAQWSIIHLPMQKTQETVGLFPGLGRSSERGNGNPFPVFLPRKSHGQRSLVSYSPWGHKELDMTWHDWAYTYRKTCEASRRTIQLRFIQLTEPRKILEWWLF